MEINKMLPRFSWINENFSKRQVLLFLLITPGGMHSAHWSRPEDICHCNLNKVWLSLGAHYIRSGGSLIRGRRPKINNPDTAALSFSPMYGIFVGFHLRLFDQIWQTFHLHIPGDWSSVATISRLMMTCPQNLSLRLRFHPMNQSVDAIEIKPTVLN